MWELDYKENWVLKNWCFWTLVLEKALESPWDCNWYTHTHTHTHTKLNHFALHQKLTQHCKSSILQFSSVQFSRSVVSDSLRPHEPQHTRPPCPSPTPGVHPNPCHRVGDAIQPSQPLLSPSPPALNLSQHQGLFKWVSSLHQVATSIK